jgi:hypothetical protein
MRIRLSKNVFLGALPVITFVLFQLFSSKAFAVSVGVSPSELRNDLFLPGTHYEQEFIVSRGFPTEDAKAIIDLDAPDVKDWIRFDPGTEFPLPKGEQRVAFKVIVDVPEDAELKNYTGSFRVKLGGLAPQGEVTVVPAVRINMNVTVGNEEKELWEVRQVTIDPFAEDQPLKIRIKINNKGNIPAKPTKVVIEVTDLSGNYIATLELYDFDEVPAFTMQDIEGLLKGHGLKKGDYFATVRVYNGDNEVYNDKVFFTVNGPSGVLGKAKAWLSQQSLGKIMVVCGGGVLAVLILVPLIGFAKKRKKKEDKNQ